MVKYKFLLHTADMKFQAYGKSREEAFKNSALALREIITHDKINSATKKIIKAHGKDNESLLYNFLEEFLFIIDSDNFIISRIDKINIDLEKFELTAIIYGDNIKKYKAITDVKAITYNSIFVRKIGEGWVCQVVVDV